MAEFDDPRHKEQIFRESCWHFDKSPILLKDFEGEQQLKLVSMIEALFRYESKIYRCW